MKTPKVSVIIPVYNGQRTLRQCLDSVLNQTYKNYNIIVIDNNSTDKTKKIIHSYKDKKISYVFEPRKGRAYARNAGINAAKGEIIAMIDADCTAPLNWIEELIKPIAFENEQASMGFETDLINNYWTKNIQKANWKFIRKNLNGNYVSHLDTKNFAVKASLIKDLMFDPLIPCMEDFEFYLRLRKVAKIIFNPSIKVGHRHKSSLKDVIKINIDRAYWTKRIFEKYKKNKEFRKEPLFESMSLRNNLTFPFWMLLRFITKSPGEAFFTLVSEISWRIGLLKK